MTEYSFGPDGTSKCESCGETYNSITSYDFSGRLCNKCSDAKKDKKQDIEHEDSSHEIIDDVEQESEKEQEKDMIGFPFKTTKKVKTKICLDLEVCKYEIRINNGNKPQNRMVCISNRR